MSYTILSAVVLAIRFIITLVLILSCLLFCIYSCRYSSAYLSLCDRISPGKWHCTHEKMTSMYSGPYSSRAANAILFVLTT